MTKKPCNVQTMRTSNKSYKHDVGYTKHCSEYVHISANSCEERKLDAKLIDSNKFIWATFSPVLYFLYVSRQTCVVICVDLRRIVNEICKHTSVRSRASAAALSTVLRTTTLSYGNMRF
jgi:hypothetical protein